jgi:hypothetical protein
LLNTLAAWSRVRAEGEEMTISPLPIRIVVLVAAMMTSAHAQTGKELFSVCVSKNPINQMSCTLYISGFVHGLQAAEDLSGEI